MPRLVSEITSGTGFQRSSDSKTVTDSQTRVFRILMTQPGEILNVQAACGVTIGSIHPDNGNLFCDSWDAKYDGDSRTVVLATFTYKSIAASEDQDKNEKPPDQRAANWSTSTSIVETPAYSWVEVGQNNNPVGNAGAPVNPVGDRYDGVSTYDAIVTISIEQYNVQDPTTNCQYAGYVNSEIIKVGSLTCPPGSVMFRGVTSKPTVEVWGDNVYKGWTASYEFAYRPNFVAGIWNGNATYDANIGWDIAVPQTGFNVKSLLGAQNVDKAGIPLKHMSGKIQGWPNAVALPDGVANGDKARGMVLVYEYENGGASQLPCAQPIPLNNDGSPRIDTANPKVIVRRYRTSKSINFRNTLGLRLSQ